MGLRINNNVESFNAHRNLSTTANRLSKSMEKLSSGLRINRAADDAAGLGISERMRGQIGGLGQAQRNAQDGMSLAATAEGSMQEIHSILHRVRELGVQYQNGTNGPEALFAITSEVTQLSAEVTRMIGAASFNGIALLGGGAAITIQVGANQGETTTISPVDVATSIGTALADFAGGTPDLTDIDAALDAVSADRATFGAVQNRLEYASNALGIAQENMMAAESRIRDVDMAMEMTNLARLQILQESGIAMLAQANQTQSSILKLLG
ncbi:MAG: flagellin domain protein [Thermoleophilia bacterium]|nr:flagellin domain protein [Thermoleophilia bacterium]